MKKKTFKKLRNRFDRAAATAYYLRKEDWFEYIPCLRPVGGKYARSIVNRLWRSDRLEEYYIHTKPSFNPCRKYVFVWEENLDNGRCAYSARRAEEEPTQHTIS